MFYKSLGWGIAARAHVLEAGHPDAGDDLESACGAGHSGMDKVPRPVVTSEGTGLVTESRNDDRGYDKAGYRKGVVTHDMPGMTGTGKGHPRKFDAGNVKVTNLSDKKLSPDQLSLLGKGLGFVPVRRQRITHLAAELKEWERLVRLKEFWSSNSEGKDSGAAHEPTGSAAQVSADRDQQYKRSHWTPERGRDPWLDVYIEEVVRGILDGVTKKTDRNLSGGEEKALIELLNDKDIIIRPADKGAGIVVMNAVDYLDRLQREVSDSSTYTPTEKEQTNTAHKK